MENNIQEFYEPPKGEIKPPPEGPPKSSIGVFVLYIIFLGPLAYFLATDGEPGGALLILLFGILMFLQILRERRAGQRSHPRLPSASELEYPPETGNSDKLVTPAPRAE